MTEQAPAGWYPQPDGTQRYWDGAQWTEHIAPGAGAAAEAPAAVTPEAVTPAAVTPAASAAPAAATPESVVAAQGEPTAVNPTVGVAVADPTEVADRPWWKKPWAIIVGAVVVVALVIVAIVAATGGSKDEPVTDDFVMPDVVGKDLADVQDQFDELGLVALSQGDATGQGRSLEAELGWQVCTQDPAAGVTVKKTGDVTVTVVLKTESCDDAQAAPQEEEPADEPTEEPVVDTDTSNLTATQQEAYDHAVSYLDFMSFSEKGLVDQLAFEGYSEADAQAAVSALNIDWNAQAVAKVKEYLDFSAFSESGMVGQLEFDGFTTEQAKAGVAGNSIDWNEQAATKAQQYLELSDFTKSGLIDQLVFEGFTNAQAKYGAEAAGL